MGGFGSGWHRGRRLAVEDGIVLDIAAIARHGHFENGKYGTWTWRQFGEVIFEVGFIVDLRNEDVAALHVITKRRGATQRQTIPLAATTPNFGGRRWWMRCPETGKRARCLYLTPGRTEFASRQALGLGYRSSQTCSKSWRNHMAGLAAKCGVDLRSVRMMFKTPRAAR